MTLPEPYLSLLKVTAALPDRYKLVVQPVVNRVCENIVRRQRLLKDVHSALEQLRLDMKYVMFDLEATRRERDELRGRL